ncbi:MAG: DUF2877 domain-containing protein [Candidatus Wallbacteria bacterium]|nr:DUF2877 domain-containing protein [Candidatus Wallbacteria bacterium]
MKVCLKLDHHLRKMFMSSRTYRAVYSCESLRSVSYRLNGCRDLTLVFDPDADPDPYTAVVTDESSMSLLKMDSFVITDGRINGLISLKDFSEDAPCLLTDRSAPDPSGTLTLESALRKSTREGMCSVFSHDDPLGNRLRTMLGALSSVNPVEPAFIPLLYHFAGLGPGSTPAGDDFICGVLSALKLYPGPWRNPPYSTLSLYRGFRKLTCRRSAGYLLSVLLGRLTPKQRSILATSAGKTCPNLENTLHTGHTSGADFAFGVWFTARSCLNGWCPWNTLN